MAFLLCIMSFIIQKSAKVYWNMQTVLYVYFSTEHVVPMQTLLWCGNLRWYWSNRQWKWMNVIAYNHLHSTLLCPVFFCPWPMIDYWQLVGKFTLNSDIIFDIDWNIRFQWSNMFAAKSGSYWMHYR